MRLSHRGRRQTLRGTLTKLVMPLSLVALGALTSACDSDVNEGVEPTSEGGLSAGDAIPSFSAADVNPNSATFEQSLSGADFQGGVAAFYFAHATWSYCSGQFGHLNTMQDELDSEDTRVPVKLVTINEAGHESGVATFTDGRDVPVLQEESGDGIWESFRIAYRDVVIVDENGVTVSIFNLTDNSLADSDNYDTLKQQLLDAAE